MRTTTRRPAAVSSVVALGLLVPLLLTACGEDDGEDGGEDGRKADVTACRTIRLTAASLDGPRTQATRGTFTPGQAAAYQVAITTVTEAVSDPEVSEEVVVATADVIGAWSRTSGIIDNNVNASSFDPGNVKTFLTAEERVVAELEAVCATE